MKKILAITLILSLLLTGSGCQKFLDIYPDDKLIQDQVVDTEFAINTVLNGIYLNMSSNQLYGANLSTTIVECLAQRYANDNANMPYIYYSTYQYSTTDGVKNALSRLWEAMYVQAMSTNDFLDILDRTTLDIPVSRKNILYGEAYALRAFIHFDILRLWGPVFSQDSSKVCMPYNMAANGKQLDMLSANAITENILADLSKAEELMKLYDPIITTGVVTATSYDLIKDFYTNRHYRMNYYAVKALQARVHLWRGDKPAALAAAKAVIEAPLVQAGRLFPWLKQEDIQTGYNPDRVFSSEIIFGIHNRSMYANYSSCFAPNLSPSMELCPIRQRLEETYENNGNDFRYTYLWKEAGGDKTYKAFYKYVAPNLTGNPNYPVKAEYFQPLIRLSEMYYIAAECAPTETDGLAYLNQVRIHRGLMSIPSISPTGLTAEIQKEYKKEFFGEGQLFYYYKRLNIMSIPSARSMGANIIMVPELPLPEAEIVSRGQ